jgi:hypothetical protein
MRAIRKVIESPTKEGGFAGWFSINPNLALNPCIGRSSFRPGQRGLVADKNFSDRKVSESDVPTAVSVVCSSINLSQVALSMLLKAADCAVLPELGSANSAFGSSLVNSGVLTRENRS